MRIQSEYRRGYGPNNLPGIKVYLSHNDKGGTNMQEIIPKSNELGIKVFINGFPEPELVSSEIITVMATALEERLNDYLKNKEKP